MQTSALKKDLVILNTLRTNPKAILHLPTFEEICRMLLIVSFYDDELYLDLYILVCGWSSTAFINHTLWSEHDNLITKN